MFDWGHKGSRFCQVLAGLLLAGLVAGCTPSEPLRVASHVWVGYEPMFLARSMGWLDPALVGFHETDSATESMAALSDGRVEAAALTLDEVLHLREAGLDLAVVLVFNISVGADVLLARPPIGSLADLRGRRVGFEHGAVGELVVVEALRQAGLTRQDIVAVDLPADQYKEAYETGMIDAMPAYEPAASRLEAQGAVKLFDSGQMPQYIVDVLAVRRDRLDSSAKALRHLVAQHLRALEYFQANPQDASFRVAPRLGLRADQVSAAFRGLVLPDALENRRLLGGAVPVLQSDAQALVEYKLEQGLLDEGIDLQSLFSARFLPSPES
ncbi:MAG: ABC transporter substrate-binding protein [Wenzhouxiangella sp.]|nr:ABC transporter substrate-binding protein [Wenzhouxiangella sp.]